MVSWEHNVDFSRNISQCIAHSSAVHVRGMVHRGAEDEADLTIVRFPSAEYVDTQQSKCVHTPCQYISALHKNKKVVFARM